jgi:hypothetical protein
VETLVALARAPVAATAPSAAAPALRDRCVAEHTTPSSVVDTTTSTTAAGAPTKRGKPGEGSFACLSGPGPLVTLSGTPAKTYKNRSLAPGTRIDARKATFLSSSSNRYPLALGGGADVCLAGGKVQGNYDRELSWETMHKTNNAGVAFKSPATVEGIRIDNVTDGIRPEGKGPFTIRRTWLSYIRDDCVENDHLQGGVIEDSLFDGCYVAISERPTKAILRHGVDGRDDLLTIRGSLLRLQPMPGPRHGGASERGNGVFFKWNKLATKLALYDNVFMAETVAQDGTKHMRIPERLVGCANNTMVWLGPGEYPAPLPDCFKVTKERSTWDKAVRDWRQRHPDVGP